jgi:hypothetical protein
VDPSDHLENTVRTSPETVVVVKLTEHVAPAVQASVTGGVYVPAAHPVPVTLNGMDCVLLNVRRTAKVAVTDCGTLIVSATGLAEPDTAPDHPLNWYPALAVADSCSVVPAA